MGYDTEKLSPKALKVIFAVLDYIKIKSEIRKRKHRILCKSGKISGVSTDDQLIIVRDLINSEILKENFVWTFILGHDVVSVGDAFFDFHKQVKNQLDLHGAKKENIESKTVGLALEDINEIDMGLDFNSEKSILYLKGHEIKISDREKIKGHYILKYIFNSEEEIGDEYSIKEIAKTEFGDDYEAQNSYKKYHHSCEYLNEKIRKATGFEEFLICTTGASATVKINEKYLD